MVSEILRRDPAARRACCRELYTLEPTQDGERQVDAAPRGRRADGGHRVSQRRRAACRLRRDATAECKCWATRRPAACTRRWWRRARPRQSSGPACSCTIPACRLRRHGARTDSRSRRRARRCSRRSRSRRAQARSPTRRSSARAPQLLNDIELSLINSAERRPRAVGVGRDRRLAPDLPLSRPAAQGEDRRRAARRGDLPQALQSHRRRCSSRPSRPIARRFRSRRTSPTLVRLQGRRDVSAAGEAFDPSPANIEARTHALEAAGRHRARAAAQEDARWRGVRSVVAALRRRGEPQESRLRARA